MESLAHQGCIYLKNTEKQYIAISNIGFLFNTYTLNIIYSCEAKLNFQHHYSSLQCHMILQKSFWNAELSVLLI